MNFSFECLCRICSSDNDIRTLGIIYDKITRSSVDTKSLTFLYLSVDSSYSLCTGKTFFECSFLETKIDSYFNDTIFSEFISFECFSEICIVFF